MSIARVAVLALVPTVALAGEPGPVRFERWSGGVFARARAEHRFVLLDLAAVWCHWCHVMEETTYRDPAVAKLLNERFVVVRADEDADPELSRRYEDWGWPATIIFAADGHELVKRRGYLEPAEMASMLRAIVDDPSPGPSVQPERAWATASGARLGAAARRALEKSFVAAFDEEHAGWSKVHKFIQADAIAYALSKPRLRPMARRTLDAALALIDPVWGGMYQYSDRLDWKSPHYEKIMSIETRAIDAYVAAYAIWRDPRHLAAARAIGTYLVEHLSGDGAFFVSQDADVDAATPGKVFYARDDAARRASAAPPVDRHVYSRENGWAAAAMVSLYTATREAAWLARARGAVEIIERQRRLGDGGFAHGDDGRGALGDTLAMGEAYARLAAVEPDGPWRGRALAALGFIETAFADRDAGYRSARPNDGAAGALVSPLRLVDENVAVARLAHRLGRADMVAQAMKLLASPTLPKAHPFSPGVLLLDDELAR